MTEFSYQLYSSRNFGPLPRTLAMLSELGYSQVEGYGALFDGMDESSIARFKSDLDKAGLTMPTAHFGLDMLEADPQRAVAAARALGVQAVYCPYLQAEDRPGDVAGWQAFARRLDEAGKPMRDAGLIFGWHNHDFEFAPIDGERRPQAIVFDTAPDLSWEADIAWIVRGGADPLEWIERYGDRISAVHIKDIAPAGQNADEDGWADVGHGTVDWPAIMTALRDTPVRYFIMEHDNPADEERFARRSIAAARTF
ncbi:sugar phosphate isomerase/epimerase family protein [Pararhizobium haloflavum]|uniref:sugar phosphate isomerase/epimerase family protein n=1 Tax=Pararhizobium haloflavum TaxID=2037914 RepID=UPI000C1A7C40|nr:sugar phosphate isomerase/epimerase [Pararhizobium haloflavum]